MSISALTPSYKKMSENRMTAIVMTVTVISSYAKKTDHSPFPIMLTIKRKPIRSTTS